MKKIVVNDIVRIGKEASKVLGIPEGRDIVVEEWYTEWNDVKEEVQRGPMIWDEEYEIYNSLEDFFGEDLKNFLDCEIVGRKAEDFTIFPYWEWSEIPEELLSL